MDKSTLKSIILDLRDNKQLTFNEISNRLMLEYNVDKSRQAVCSLYNRASSNLDSEQALKQRVIDNDIVNLASLAYNNSEILQLLETKLNADSGATYYSVSKCVEQNVENIKTLRRDIVNVIIAGLNAGRNMDIICEHINYKGIVPKQSGLKQLLCEAVTVMISKDTARILAGVISKTGDTSIVKSICNKHNLDISTFEIKNIINKEF